MIYIWYFTQCHFMPIWFSINGRLNILSFFVQWDSYKYYSSVELIIKSVFSQILVWPENNYYSNVQLIFDGASFEYQCDSCINIIGRLIKVWVIKKCRKGFFVDVLCAVTKSPAHRGHIQTLGVRLCASAQRYELLRSLSHQFRHADARWRVTPRICTRKNVLNNEFVRKSFYKLVTRLLVDGHGEK